MTKTPAIAALRRRAGIKERQLVDALPDNLPKDPLEARTILEELVDTGKTEAVLQLIRGLDPNPSWSDLATHAAIKEGRWEDAKRLFDFSVGYSGSRATLPGKTMASAIYALLSPISAVQFVPRKDLTPEAETFASQVLQDIYRRLTALSAHDGITTSLDYDLCACTAQLQAWLGLRDQTALPIGLLLRYKEKFPKHIAVLMEQEFIAAHPEVPDRLRLDYPDDLVAQQLAAAIDGRLLNNPGYAFRELVKRRGLAKTDEERVALRDLLAALAEESGDPDAGSMVRELREFWSFSDPRLQDLANSIRHIERGEYAKASALLEKHRELADSAWYRTCASLQIAKGETREAAHSLFEAAKQGHWLGFVQAAELAYTTQDWDLARQSLEEARVRQPHNRAIRNNLIAVYERLNRLQDVETLLKDLATDSPDDATYLIRYTRYLMEQGRYAEALDTLSGAPSVADSNLNAALLRAHLLRTLVGPQPAQEYLDSLVDKYNDDKKFWFGLLDLSYAAGKDERGHEALEKLLALKARGLVSDQELWSQSIEDITQFVKQRQERRSQVGQHIAQGKLPWLEDARLNGESAWVSWMMRTQPLVHMWDAPSQKTNFSVYATNGFTIVRGQDGSGELIQTSLPVLGSSVAADLTALMTLTQLGLLEEVSNFFDRIFISNRLSPHLLMEARRLRPHQKSQFDTAAMLLDGLATQKIKTTDEPVSEFQGQVLDPYRVLGRSDVIGFGGILRTLRNAGKISQNQFDANADLFKGQESDDETVAEAVPDGSLLIEETALRMISRRTLLDAVADSYTIFLSAENAQELRSQIRAYESLDNIRMANEQLVNWIGSTDGMQVETVVDEDDMGGGWIYDSYQLAKRHNISLLADDRVWHALRANETHRELVFDSASLVAALGRAGALDMEQRTDKYLQLLKWRYKFCIVPSDVMFAMALRYKEGVPGEQLRLVARYIHDCASDPSMLGGLEAVTPPTSMAIRWTVSWMAEIASFLVLVWDSDLIEREQRLELSAWVARCMLPTVPVSMHHQQRVNLSRAMSASVLHQCLIRAAQCTSVEQVHEGFTTFSRALGLEQKRVDIIVEDLVQGIISSD